MPRTGPDHNPPQPVAARIARIVPTARPGPQAPLGWSLSSYARDDLKAQLRSPANLCQIALVRSWFDPVPSPGATRCVTGFAVREPNSPDGIAPADSIRQLTGPIDTNYHGVANVVLKGFHLRLAVAPDLQAHHRRLRKVQPTGRRRPTGHRQRRLGPGKGRTTDPRHTAGCRHDLQPPHRRRSGTIVKYVVPPWPPTASQTEKASTESTTCQG